MRGVCWGECFKKGFTVYWEVKLHFHSDKYVYAVDAVQYNCYRYVLVHCCRPVVSGNAAGPF